jgi:hypothetical protein
MGKVNSLLDLLPKKPIRFLGIKVNEELLPVTREELLSKNISPEGRYQLKGTEHLEFEYVGDGKYQPRISWFDGF